LVGGREAKGCNTEWKEKGRVLKNSPSRPNKNFQRLRKVRRKEDRGTITEVFKKKMKL